MLTLLTETYLQRRIDSYMKEKIIEHFILEKRQSLLSRFIVYLISRNLLTPYNKIEI